MTGFLQYIKQAEGEGRKAKVADFGKQVEDAQFLNSLQSGVNRWIREIQKVIILDLWYYGNCGRAI